MNFYWDINHKIGGKQRQIKKKKLVKQAETIFNPARQVVINVPSSVNYRLPPTKIKIFETAIKRANMRIVEHSLVEVGQANLKNLKELRKIDVTPDLTLESEEEFE